MAVRLHSNFVIPSFTNASSRKPAQISRRFCVENCRSGNLNAENNSRKLIREVKKKLEKVYGALPVGKNGRDDEDMILWFLKDWKFSVNDAVMKLSKAIDPIHDEKLCVFLIEKALSKLPAGKEQILGVVDLQGFGIQNADIRFLTFLFDVFYYYYPRRLGEVLFVEAPFVFQPVWQLAKPMLKSYASLVRFCSVETICKEYFTEETLPANFRSDWR